MLANTAAANGDPVAFIDSVRIDITRENTVGILGFGDGAHYCLGSHLARLELTRALTVMAPAHAQPAPHRTSPVAVNHRSHRTHHPARRGRARMLNPGSGSLRSEITCGRV